MAATTETPVSPAPATPANRGRHAVSGVVAALAALGAAELVAGLLTEVPSLLDAVGTFVIDMVPPGVKDAAIAVFGTNDKTALRVGTLLVIAGIGAVVGLLAARWMGWGVIAFAVFAVTGALAAMRIPDASSPGVLITAAVAAVVGIVVLTRLLRLSVSGADADRGRRAFIVAAGSVVAMAALAAAGGRFLADRARRMLAGRDDVVLPAAAETVAPPPARASFQVRGLSPLITPNADFYRIDTALTVPRVDLTTWRLGFTGMVDHPFEVDFADLINMPMVERHITIACVSNEVGGDLIGTAKWLGVPLPALLERAGQQPGATQIVGRSADGFTVGFPTEAALDGRDALVAVGMNGEPLPIEHGFPARLIVAGLYGYVSATKWLTEVELTSWDAFDAYWVPRGWSKEAPIKTQSRVDVPADGTTISAGQRTIAGVAWAPTRGISAVEVRVDGGQWQPAELASELADTTWRQWRIPWEAASGAHSIMVRATDGTGEVQTDEVAPPAPDGATGYHSIVVNVE
jgi:DMSO/TMAO reductase YedYZ molybdopterin-dependent catalytic subunit